MPGIDPLQFIRKVFLHVTFECIHHIVCFSVTVTSPAPELKPKRVVLGKSAENVIRPREAERVLSSMRDLHNAVSES